ncbi:MAG: DUF6338 family protein [Candidatus Acidiferrales bacterium]
MADLKFEALVILIVLLPGFFAARIEQRLTVNPDQDEFDRVVEALIYSFFIYVIFTLIDRTFPVALKIKTQGSENSYSYSLVTSPLLLALLPLIALVLAVLVSSATNRDWFGRFFRWIGVTSRTWRPAIWNDVFLSHSGIVQVELADRRSVIGWLKYYSDRPVNASLFLERASWVREDGGLTEIAGPGILLTGERGIRSIMFLDHTVSESPQPHDDHRQTERLL